MNKNFILIIALLFAHFIAKGQNLFMIGEKSYPCTNAITLEPNSNSLSRLEVYFAKEGNNGLIGLIRKVRYDESIVGKVIVYLDNGDVITCIEHLYAEKVDDYAKAIYNLTADQLNKLKSASIHTVKYNLGGGPDSGSYSASNNGIKTSAIIREFFDAIEESNDIDNSDTSHFEETKAIDSENQEPFAYVEQMPSFPNGSEAMYKYIYDNLKYPAIARESNITGQVIVQFVVSENGDIQNARVVRGIGGGCNEEALRIVNSMPLWYPGKHNGRNVAVTFTLPIKFIL